MRTEIRDIDFKSGAEYASMKMGDGCGLRHDCGMGIEGMTTLLDTDPALSPSADMDLGGIIGWAVALPFIEASAVASVAQDEVPGVVTEQVDSGFSRPAPCCCLPHEEIAVAGLVLDAAWGISFPAAKFFFIAGH